MERGSWFGSSRRSSYASPVTHRQSRIASHVRSVTFDQSRSISHVRSVTTYQAMREDFRNAVSRVDQDRLWRRHAEMARIGAIPGNGVNRAALSNEDIAARRLLLSW